MSIRSVSKSWTRSNLIGLLAFIAFIGTLPLWVRTPYALSNMVLIGIYSLVTIGLCLLMGYAGQISLGQAAFFGLGAYGSGILTVRFGWSPWIALLAAALLTAAVAYLIGMPMFRLRSHYLAMGTLAFGAIVTIVMNEWRAYTGGPTGLPGIPRFMLGATPIKSDLAYYYLAWGMTLIGLIVALNLIRSRFGRALRAIHDSEPAAQSLGVDTGRYKLITLVISAIYASVAGSLYAHYIIFISPNAFDFNVSVRLVLMVAVGGLASIWGAPFGTAAVILLTMALREVVPLFSSYGSGEYQIIAYGALLVVIMIFMPDGLTVALVRAWRRLLDSETLRRRLRALWRRP
ncbi:MAG: branched-chain amino acid ABC transporter permease [Chloroflexi bacterium]|jgi:branched-chain amino acid transport system permease protein|nr:branched-chain amino acid ABC transporter permease [Chloroflexota bacterium]